MTPNRLTLDGCSTRPLASYLKALGILRLLSSGTNSVKGKPADRTIRGWWEGDKFHLKTLLERRQLLRFFLHEYAPSPVIAPWNGASGFYAKGTKAGIRPLSVHPVAKRFRMFSSTIQVASETLAELRLDAAPKGNAKRQLVAHLRARLPEPALPWLDAALVLSADRLRFPQLLGTGGNDGHLDFTNNLMQRLVSEDRRERGLFDASSGVPNTNAGALLECALLNTPIHALTTVKIGQFSPGGAGGPNATAGYTGGSIVNPWDYVFMLEGAATFACAATRRLECNTRSQASFPFTVRSSGAGWGGIEATDESDARAEFWAPLWSRPARYCEVESLFGEGRAVTNGRTARDGLDFARALASLGVSRGLSQFQRYGFLRRAGNNHYAAALERRQAAPSIGTALVADLDRGGWLNRVRRLGRTKNQPASVRNAVKYLEDSLFDLLSPDGSDRAVRAALRAVGRLGIWLSNSPKARDTINPPPPLSKTWLLQANDGTAEFRIASALAGLGICRPTSTPSSASPDSGARRSGGPPMAAHLAPLTNGPQHGFERDTFFLGASLRRDRKWARDSNPPTVVWGHGGLVTNMVAVLGRRLVESSVRGLPDKPLDGFTGATLSDVVAFLTGDFDDARCADLIAGMVWAQPSWLPASDARSRPVRATVPFAYAALKPIFVTNHAMARIRAIPEERTIPVPPGLIAQLWAGSQTQNGRKIDAAVQTAFTRMRSSGLPSAYDPTQSGAGVATLRRGRIGVGLRPDRLAAAMLIPISDRGLATILRRAYPGTVPATTAHSSEESQDVN